LSDNWPLAGEGLIQVGSSYSPAEAGLSQTNSTGPDALLPGVSFVPSYIPAFDFSPVFAGLVSVADVHSDTERKQGNARQVIGEIHNV
jgi:hypothetical protein